MYRATDSFVERCRKARIREIMTGIVLKDIITYMVFLFIVGKLAYAEKDMSTYHFRNDIMNMFQHGKYQMGPVFDEVRYLVIFFYVCEIFTQDSFSNLKKCYRLPCETPTKEHLKLAVFSIFNHRKLHGEDRSSILGSMPRPLSHQIK